MDEIRIIILGDCIQTTDLLETCNREHHLPAGAISGTAERIRQCMVHGQWFWAVTREKTTSEIGELHCFENASPPDAFVLVDDSASGNSLWGVHDALGKIVAMDWGPRVRELSVIPQKDNTYVRDKTPASSFRDLFRLRKRFNKSTGRFTCFPRLPVELQLAVLRACLTSPCPILDSKPHLNAINTNILLVNKSFHKEGTRIFKAENRFLPRQPIYVVTDTTPTCFDGEAVPSDAGQALANQFGVEFRQISFTAHAEGDSLFLDIMRECVLRVRDGLPGSGGSNVTFPEKDGWAYRGP